MPRRRRREPVREIDLHGLDVARALARLEAELVYCRARRLSPLRVITGRGLNSEGGKPVLRPAVEAWLRGPSGRALAVAEVHPIDRGGALWVRLRWDAPDHADEPAEA